MTELGFVVVTVCTKQCGKQREGADLPLRTTRSTLHCRLSVDGDLLFQSCTQTSFRTFIVDVGQEDHTTASSCGIPSISALENRFGATKHVDIATVCAWGQ